MTENVLNRIVLFYRINGFFFTVKTIIKIFLNILRKTIERIRISFYKLILWDNLLIKKVQKSKMILNLDDIGISRELLLKGIHERNSTNQFKKEIKEGMSLLEIGANIGYYTLIAARIIKKKGHIYAFEPSPQNTRFLVANIYTNGLENIVEVHREGVADKTGKLPFFLYTKSNLCSFAKREPEEDIKQTGKIIVDVTTVDKFLGNRKIDYLRMDIEGFEYEAIKGMKNTLENKERSPKGMFIEMHSALLRKNGYSANEFINTLAAYGYSVKKSFYRGRADISANSTNDLLKHNLLEKGYWETFFIKS